MHHQSEDSDAQDGGSTVARIETETSKMEGQNSTSQILSLFPEDIASKIVPSRRAMDLDKSLERKTLRRIDMVLMPIMFISYGLQYIDKNVLNTASQFGIIQDLGLDQVVGYKQTAAGREPIVSSVRFSNVTLIFYWGNLCGG